MFTLLFLLTAIDDVEVRKLLDNRVNVAKKATGIVVGILDGKGRRVIAQGPAGMNGDTVFEIGSITKVFTGILLADMAERGEVKLSDPVAKHLPTEARIPAYEGREITLLDLTTQTSGLPRLPANLKPADLSNPYADYTPAQMFEFLGGYKLTRAPGEKYDYSNLGVGLLGFALAHRAGKSYEALVTERILKPLGMTRSSITLSSEQKANFAEGHNADLTPAKNWDIPTIAGAGALRSTVNDMLKFLAANIGEANTPLGKAMRASHAIQKPAGGPDMSIGMGWHVVNKYGHPLTWHNGGTGGYRSWAGFAPSTHTAAVVLCDTSFAVDDLGLHFTAAPYPAVELPAARKELTVDRTLLQKYAGKYELIPGFVIAITEEDGKLFLQATGQPKFSLFASSQTDFFLKVVDASVTFHSNEAGDTPELTLHQNGDRKAKRIP
jgi:CubicO group peptidase (beta-lactamase class C family)